VTQKYNSDSKLFKKVFNNSLILTFSLAFWTWLFIVSCEVASLAAAKEAWGRGGYNN